MYKLQHFVAKHKIASFIVLTCLICVIYSMLLITLNVPTWVLIIVNLVLAFIIYAWVEYSPGPIMNKAIKELNDNCNPYPLLQETETLLTYKNSEVLKQMILINHAVAYRSIGEYRHNYEILSLLNIDKASGTLPTNKIVYYNNLMDACALLGRYEEACVWYSKMMLIHADLTNQKQLEMLAPTIQRAKAFYYYCKTDYENALQLLEQIPSIDRRAAVDNAMLYAKVALAMGKMEITREKLDFIIANGNRLYAVTEARKMLEEITE